ncbi:MAG: sulfite exporter TauE/SafE family protein [Chloroflexi bacterium]|nr:sulfite exporter TauE/SafE family protein [Chloroflexota bacterium]
MDWLEFVALIGVGIAVGVYATAVGAGGGFLFAPVLLPRHAEASPAEVALASMCLVLASSGLATARLAREKRVDYRAVGMAAAIAVPAGLIGATGTAQLPREIFAAGFATLLALLGAYLIWRPTGDAGTLGRRGWRRMIRDRRGELYLYWIPVRRSLAVIGVTSILTSLAGIGGGLFFATITIRVMRMPAWLGVPASHAIVSSIALVVVIYHTTTQHFGDPLTDVPPLLIGAMIANPIGLVVATRMRESLLSRLLAIGMLVVAVRVAFEAV